jgi:hypothetical protein
LNNNNSCDLKDGAFSQDEDEKKTKKTRKRGKGFQTFPLRRSGREREEVTLYESPVQNPQKRKRSNEIDLTDDGSKKEKKLKLDDSLNGASPRCKECRQIQVDNPCLQLFPEDREDAVSCFQNV